MGVRGELGVEMLPGEHLDGMECHESGDHLGVSVARKGKGAGV